MVMNKNTLPRKGLWIATLAVQGLAVLLFSRYLITLDLPTNVISLIVVLGAYLAILIPTVNVIRGKTKSRDFTVALGILNIVATIIAIGFLVFVAGLYDALHY